MAEELSLDSIKDMKKADFIKAFKNKAAWKKAKAVIFLVDYKLEGKKAVIAIPFKKENEMKLEMKRLKKEKLHLLKKSGGGTIVIDKNANGDREATIELIMGGLKPELLQLKASPLFEKIKVKLSATQTGEALEDAAAAESEVDTTENLPEDNLDDVDADAEEGEEDNEGETASQTETATAPNPKKEKFMAALNLIKENAEKLKAAFGKIAGDKLQSNAEKLKTALDKIMNEAREFIHEVGEEAKELVDDVKNIVKEALNPNETASSNDTASLDRDKLKNYADQGKSLAAEFKSLQATIKKNLADLQSEKEDVDMVNAMIEKVQKHEDIFDAMSAEEQEKVQKMRDTINSKITPELEKMTQDVLRYLKVRDKVLNTMDKTKEAALKSIEDMKSRIEKLKADIDNLITEK
jgi:ElaB/YqjD/DUF883 family membrane-anchored ribosome-binding protein